MFCKESHGQFYTVLKKLENLIGKLRTAKQAYDKTQSKLKEFETVKFNPLECINSHFDNIKAQINAHKENTILYLTSLVNIKNKEVLDSLDLMKSHCIEALECKYKVNTNDEMSNIKSIMNVWRKDLDLNDIKISEIAWENIRLDSYSYIQLIDDKIAKVKKNFLLNKEIKFECDVKKLELINYGTLTIHQNNLNSVEKLF